MPRNADREAGSAMDLIFLLRVLTPTASAAAPWATLAAVAIGIQMFCPLSASIESSMALYIWCTPATTVGAYAAPIRNEPIPNGMEMSHCAPVSTHVSSWEKIGPITVMVRNPVTRTDTSGVTNRSSISGTRLCSHFSITESSNTAITTGIT